MERLLTENQLRRRVVGADKLPTIPVVFAKGLRLIGDENSLINDLEAVIRKDQSLVTKLLRMANSAYYGMDHDISSIKSPFLNHWQEQERSLEKYVSCGFC